jgi:DNA mismatch repair ATPase MutS
MWQITLALYALLMLNKTMKINEPFKEASRLRDILAQLSAVFRQLETVSYGRTPHLAQLCRPFHQSEQKPSNFLKRLNRIVNATGLRGNPVFALLLNILFPYDIFFAYKLQRARQELAGKLPGWMDIWFEIESLASLANLAYLNPHYTFPTFNTAGSINLFQTRQMGHPLLPDTQKVRNDFTINHTGFIGILTGSNMSGKSTFLRTVGVNLALAYSGGPVDAAYLQTAFFRLHTCIRISDSITSGISHFYAEVRCLKSLMNALETADPHPLLYLIDEIFQGTNNRERLTGSRSFIRALAKQPGVGLISTHDLELAQLADEIPSLRNYHFEDTVGDGRLHFDYHIQPGPSPTTNALKIMKLEGLPVEE